MRAQSGQRGVSTAGWSSANLAGSAVRPPPAGGQAQDPGVQKEQCRTRIRNTSGKTSFQSDGLKIVVGTGHRDRQPVYACDEKSAPCGGAEGCRDRVVTQAVTEQIPVQSHFACVVDPPEPGDRGRRQVSSRKAERPFIEREGRPVPYDVWVDGDPGRAGPLAAQGPKAPPASVASTTLAGPVTLPEEKAWETVQ